MKESKRSSSGVDQPIITGLHSMKRKNETHVKLIEEELRNFNATTVRNDDNLFDKSSKMVKIIRVLENITAFAERSSNNNAGECGDFNSMSKAIYDKIRYHVDTLLYENYAVFMHVW